jgi:hypothetical protein
MQITEAYIQQKLQSDSQFFENFIGHPGFVSLEGPLQSPQPILQGLQFHAAEVGNALPRDPEMQGFFFESSTATFRAGFLANKALHPFLHGRRPPLVLPSNQGH